MRYSDSVCGGTLKSGGRPRLDARLRTPLWRLCRCAPLGGELLLVSRRGQDRLINMMPSKALQPTPGAAGVCNSSLGSGVAELGR